MWKLKHNYTLASAFLLVYLIFFFHSSLAQFVLHRVRKRLRGKRRCYSLLRHAGSEKWTHQLDCPVTVSSHQRGECWTLEPLHFRLPVRIQPSHTHTHRHQNPFITLPLLSSSPLSIFVYHFFILLACEETCQNWLYLRIESHTNVLVPAG